MCCNPGRKYCWKSTVNLQANIHKLLHIINSYKPTMYICLLENNSYITYSFLDCFSFSSVGSGRSLTVACHVMLARSVVIFVFTSGFFSSDSVDFLPVPASSLSFALSLSSGLPSCITPIVTRHRASTGMYLLTFCIRCHALMRADCQ